MASNYSKTKHTSKGPAAEVGEAKGCSDAESNESIRSPLSGRPPLIVRATQLKRALLSLANGVARLNSKVPVESMAVAYIRDGMV